MIPMTEYAKRREAVMRSMGANSIAILPSAQAVIRNNDTHYPFRQNSDFYYLTGFEEPEAMLVLLPNRKEGEYLLFNRVRDRDKEIWDGPRAGQAGACTEFLADAAYPIAEFYDMLPALLENKTTIYYSLGYHPQIDERILAILTSMHTKFRSGMQTPVGFTDLTTIVHEMRLRKSPAEIAVIQKAVDITTDAHIKAMQYCKPGVHEYQLEAELLYQFNKNGSRAPAYTSIVGAGKNSCILHYIANNEVIKDGDIVLIDAGAEYQNYAADITRTFPANGKFSPEQKAIYELVLDSQLAAIKSIKPGSSWTKAQEIIVEIITQGLVDLGILKGNVKELIANHAYFPFYMHRSGHWLGLDVHDAGRYRVNDKWRELEPGMVLTVEPGIYIAETIPGVPKRWHNIGVRIEDNVLVTKTGCEVLSARIPKTVADIEALIATTRETCSITT